MSVVVRSVAELAEEAAGRLTSEQLHALAARVAAAERRPEPEPRPKADLATCVALDLGGTVRRLAALWGPGGYGVDINIVGAWLLPQLVRAGVAEVDALEALQRVTGWHPRSDEERLEAVVRGMLADGFSLGEIKAALRAVERVATA